MGPQQDLNSLSLSLSMSLGGGAKFLYMSFKTVAQCSLLLLFHFIFVVPGLEPHPQPFWL
jgi:hypothetical protein